MTWVSVDAMILLRGLASRARYRLRSAMGRQAMRLSIWIRHVGGIHLTGLAQVSGSPWPSRSRAVHAWRIPPFPGGLECRLLRLRVDNQVAIMHRVVGDGELECPTPGVQARPERDRIHAPSVVRSDEYPEPA